MDIRFVAPTGRLADRTAERVARFDGHHAALVGVEDSPELSEARETVAAWQAEDHELYVIEVGGSDVGFVHLWFKGPIVVWVEDLWVDEDQRGRGIASATFEALEAFVASEHPEVEAISLDVAPRNEDALRLYHRLGYDAISLVTLRKTVRGKDRRERRERFLGREFRL